MSIYKEIGGYPDWRGLRSGASGLELVAGYDRSRCIREFRETIAGGHWDGLKRVNHLLESLRDHLRATSGNWRSFDADQLAELREAMLNNDTAGKLVDSNGVIPPVLLLAVVDRIRQIMFQEVLNP